MKSANAISTNSNTNDTNIHSNENIERLQKKVAESQSYLNDLQEQFAALKRRKAREHEEKQQQQQYHHHNHHYDRK